MRLRRLSKHCYSGNTHTAVADLAPVVGHYEPLAILRVEGRLEAFMNQIGPYGILRRLAQVVVEPVVADGKSLGHLGHIQKVGRIPVHESRGAEHLLLCPGSVFFNSLSPVGVAEEEHPAENLAGDGVHTRALDDSPAKRKSVDDGAFVDYGRMHPGPDFVLGDIAHEGFLLACSQVEPRVILLRNPPQAGKKHPCQEENQPSVTRHHHCKFIFFTLKSQVIEL